jgi:hypothetical protein
VVHVQGRRPAAIFYPFEHPTPYVYVFGRNGDGQRSVDLLSYGVIFPEVIFPEVIFSKVNVAEVN